MLDEEKLKLMMDLAFYEQNQGKEDFKINEYYRNDYTGFHTVCTIIWVTLGYAGVVGIGLFAALDFFLINLSKTLIIKMIFGIIGGYLAVLVIYLLITQYVFNQKYKNARQRIKLYNQDLTCLLKMYEKEKK